MTNNERRNNHNQTTQGDPGSEREHGVVGRIVGWIALAIGAPIFAIILSVVVLFALGISIDLSWLRPRIEAAATEVLDRSVSIEGPITVIPALTPSVQVEGIRLGNPAGWPDAEFVGLDLVRGQLGVLPLVRGDLQIEEITIEGLAVNLEISEDGERNWLVTSPGEPSEPEEVEAAPEEESAPLLRFVELRELSLKDIALSFRDAGAGTSRELRLDRVTGNAEDDQPMHLVVEGSAEQVPFSLTMDTGSLASLLDRDRDGSWTLEATASALDTTLTIGGDIAQPLLGRGLALEFVLTGPRVEELEKILGTDLPPIPNFDLRGNISEAAGEYRVSELQGSLGTMAFTGDLGIDTSGDRPRMRGMIDVPLIDAGFVAAAVEAGKQAEAGEETPPAAVAEPDEQPIDIDEPLLTLEPLQLFDADFTLTIHEVANGPVAIDDAELRLTVADGRLIGPISATVAGVPFSGEARLEPEDSAPAASVSLSGASSDIGDLLALLTGIEGIRGSFESVDLGVSSRGETLRSLIQTTELDFSLAGAALSYGHGEGEQPVEFTLDKFDMVFPASDESRVAAAGTLLKEPFSLELSGGTFIQNYVERNWPFDMTAAGSGAEIRLYGRLADFRTDPKGDLTLSVAGERVGDLARWIGVTPDAESSYALNGVVSLADGAILAKIDEARLGDTGFAGTFGLRQVDNRPVTVVDLRVGVVDTAELAALFPAAPESAAEEAPAETLTIDVPILPTGIELTDSDITAAIERIKMARGDVTDVSFSSQIRDGYMEQAPVRAVVAGAALEGTVSIDLRGQVPAFDLALQSTDVKVGEMLAQLGVAQGFDVTAGQFDLDLAVKGAEVRTILQQSEFSAGIRNGRLRLQDPNTQGSLDIGIARGSIEAKVGAPITLAIDGNIEETPVRIALRTDSLGSFAEPKDSLSATLDVALLNATLQLTGRTPLPVAPDNLRFSLNLAGERFNDFDEFLDVSLPPWGPYSLAGEFGSRRSGYYIRDLRLGVGSSTLTGTLDLDTTQAPPRLDVELVAPTVQLDDFDTGDWQVSEEGAEAQETAETDVAEASEPAVGEDVRDLLSPEVMRSLQGRMTVNVEEVVSGEDQLGSGSLIATLEDGKFTVDPLTLEVPGGSVELGFALEPTETDIGLEARANIDQLDYGLLARRIDPESTTGGLISVDVDITTRGTDMSNIMAGSNGHIDFAVWPQDLEAGIFDLWAVNLFTAVLPSLDSEASVINCLVARFKLDDGIMTTTALLVDSSRIQASGEGTVNFRDETVTFAAAPRSKRPQLFSANTPIQVEGEIRDFQFGPQPGAVVGSTFRIITSPVVVPFQWIFTERVEADGVAACNEAWGRPAEG